MALQSYTALAALFLTMLNAVSAQTWTPLGKGTNSSVVSAIITDSTGNVYAGGDFYKAGDVFAEGIAKWDGQEWNALGAGVDGKVLVLKYFNNVLHIGGEFINAGGQLVNCIATWDGNTWTGFGEGMFKSGGHTFTTSVRDMAMYKGELFAVGVFDNAGGKKANFIARWTGATWEPVGAGINGSYVNSLVVFNDELYVGGNFTSAGGASASNIAKWNGASWSAVGDGLNGVVSNLKVNNGTLYACGPFTASGAAAVKYIATWDGQSWAPLSNEAPNADVFAIDFWNGKLIAGGIFTQAGGIPANRIAMYDGAAWSALGAGVDALVNVVHVDSASHNIYVGGRFEKAGGITVNHIARMQLQTNIRAESNEIPKLPVFPHPATKGVNITLPDDISDANCFVTIKNILGQEINVTYSYSGNIVHINRGRLPSGIYCYTITNRNRISTHGVFIFE